MLDIEKEIEKGEFLREATEERISLYNLMRKRFPKGKEKAQLKLCMEISDERIPVYVDMFSENQ
jgi:hypothetical protein